MTSIMEYNNFSWFVELSYIFNGFHFAELN